MTAYGKNDEVLLHGQLRGCDNVPAVREFVERELAETGIFMPEVHDTATVPGHQFMGAEQAAQVLPDQVEVLERNSGCAI